jgi:DNA invertase Pin-like site-specific DNA recombinase
MSSKGQRIGYVRVSSYDQNPDRQLEHLDVDRVFTGGESPMANLMLSVLGAAAQFKRDLIRERQREGIALAKQRGETGAAMAHSN